MQFGIPKYIEIEDKIVGPLTFKQSLYIGTGIVISLILWFYLKFLGFLIISIIVNVICLALAFYKPHGFPLSHWIKVLFKYLFKPKLYIWRK